MSKIITYSDFKRAFDELGNSSESLMRPSKPGSPLHDLTEFSRTHPRQYAEYKKRMHDEALFEHNKSVQSKEYW